MGSYATVRGRYGPIFDQGLWGLAMLQSDPAGSDCNGSAVLSQSCLILILRRPRSGRLEGCRPQTGLMVRDALRAPHHEELL